MDSGYFIDARLVRKLGKRSVTMQIEHWAMIGKIAEENPEVWHVVD